MPRSLPRRALGLARGKARPVAFRLDPREHPVEIAHVVGLARGGPVGEGARGMKFFRRSSQPSTPITRAALSIERSSAKIASGRPAPR
jgi:hypothetical protein